MSTPAERKTEISKAILTSIAGVKDADWSKTSPEISAAEAELNEAMEQYVEGGTSRANVRAVYQKWRDLHKTGALFG